MFNGFNWRRWSIRAGVRAVKTAAQTAVTLIGFDVTGADSAVGLGDVPWAAVGSVAVVAAITSLLTSLRGLPELDQETEPVD